LALIVTRIGLDVETTPSRVKPVKVYPEDGSAVAVTTEPEASE